MNLKKIIRFLTSKLFIVAILILIQLAFLTTMVLKLSEYFLPVYFILIALSFIVSIYVLNKNEVMHSVTVSAHRIVLQTNYILFVRHRTDPYVLLHIVPWIPVHFIAAQCRSRSHRHRKIYRLLKNAER